jgi:inosose dehydratase
MKRREFLALMAAAPAAAYGPSLVGQAYVWTQYLAKEKRSLADGLDEVFTGLAQAGYRQLELTSNFLTPELAPRTAELLARHCMTLPMVYNGGPMHEAAGAQKMRDATLSLADRVKPLGVSAIVINPDPKPKREPKTAAELDHQAAATRELSKELGRKGFRLLLHQHAPEMAGGAREWRHLLQNTSAQELGVCLDVDWIQRGGQDVMTLLRESAPRIGDLHLRNSRNGIWLEELADGDIDYRSVARYLRETGYQGYLTVELAWEANTQLTRPLVESLTRSRVYAERVFDVRS